MNESWGCIFNYMAVFSVSELDWGISQLLSSSLTLRSYPLCSPACFVCLLGQSYIDLFLADSGLLLKAPGIDGARPLAAG